MKRLLYLLTLLLFTFVGCFAEAFELKNDKLVLHFNEMTGKISSVDWQGKTICQSDPNLQWFDFYMQKENENKGEYQFGKHPIQLRTLKKIDEFSVLVSLGYGDWTFDYLWKLDPKEAEFHCFLKIRYDGEKEVRLKSLWFDFPEFIVNETSRFYGPGLFPPKSYQAKDLKPGEKKSFYQGTPITIVERDRQCSALFLVDNLGPTADRGGLSVENKVNINKVNINKVNINKDNKNKENGNAIREDELRQFRISSNSDICARMKKGTVQELGAFWCRLVPGDGETALLQIHDWMKKRGHVIPSDRPKWFESAILYSFHPGGTIGSNCKDLGGFVNSLAQLDRIHALNMNAIWLMPLEDVSIYCPRDYYKFQEGLGTGDDYKRLVRLAHELQLHVLQDCVPHGGRNTFERALQHPEWLVYDEEGKTLDYWCFDFNYPTWKEYMANVVRHYVKEYDIDGYRVDAVGGSKIPNWNPDIPYARASYAKLQGGLNMLRSLRNAVQNEKPKQAGLLAETTGSVYGVVSDAIYDFVGCYSVYHQLRHKGAADFVNELRRWLHEEQYSEVEGLLRLRHSESHDSLRTMGWYGIQPGRAVVALTSFIHGIPLVYHDEDIGHFFAFRKLFGIRNLLPELQGGKADYLGLVVPDGVFAVRRYKDNLESFAFINFNEDPVEFDIALDKASVVTDMMKEKRAPLNKGQLKVSLNPYEYNVYALRAINQFNSLSTKTESAKTEITDKESSNKANTVLSSNTQKNGVEGNLIKKDKIQIQDMTKGSDNTLKTLETVKTIKETDPNRILTLSGAKYQALIDRKTGLLLSFSVEGKLVLGPSDLWLSSQVNDIDKNDIDMNKSKKEYDKKINDTLDKTSNKILSKTVVKSEIGKDKQTDFIELSLSEKGDNIDVRRQINGNQLSIRYKAEPTGLKIETSWMGNRVPINSLMSFVVLNAEKWNALTGEGELSDVYRVRPEGGKPGTSSIYWRVQGTDILYDSLFLPFMPFGTKASSIGSQVKNGKGVAFNLHEIPTRVQWSSRTEKEKQLTAFFYWTNTEVPFAVKPKWSLTLSPEYQSAPLSACLLANKVSSDIKFKAVAGGWRFENQYYQLKLARNGSISQLVLGDKANNNVKNDNVKNNNVTNIGLTNGKTNSNANSSIVASGEIYTDYGFGTEGLRYSSKNEVEVASRLDYDGKYLRLRFYGRPRGFGRFELLNPGLDYMLEYRLGTGPSFELTSGVKGNDPKYRYKSFLSFYLSAPGIDSFVYKKKDKEPISGSSYQSKERVFIAQDTKVSENKEKPEFIELQSNKKPVLTISRILGYNPQSIFMVGNDFFMTFCDGKEWDAEKEGSWSAIFTVGANQPETFPTVTEVLKKTLRKRNIDIMLYNGEMDPVPMKSLISERTEEHLLLQTGTEPGWQLPDTGKYVSEPKPVSGKSCLEIRNTTGEYLLARQALSSSRFLEGTRWRFSAMVKGENIVRGKEEWKTGLLRWVGTVDNKTAYQCSESLLGTFNWRKVSVEWTIPKKMSSLYVELGLNGSTGKIWFDQAEIEQIK